MATVTGPGSGGKAVAEHWQSTLGFSLACLVLQDIPVLGEPAVFDPDDIGSDPRNGAAVA
jgi:hypothetical protein